MHCFRYPFNLVISVIFLLITTGSIAHANDEIRHEVKDLPYGVALFHFFQEEYFSAITDILVAKHYRTLKNDNKNSELLLGGLYLSYGLQHKADMQFSDIISHEDENEKIRSQIINEQKKGPADVNNIQSPWALKEPETQIKTPQYIRDRAWFQLGKNHYQNGYINEAEMALTTIKGTLNDEHEAERQYLLTNIFIQTDRLETAKQTLNNINEDSIWKEYAKYNLGTALIKRSQLYKGTEILKELSESKFTDRERLILQDKANIALGYTFLKTNNPVHATGYFANVKLNGSESNRALLGNGWAWYQLSNFDQSLTPWMELANRDKTDPSVQEALISIPNSFEKINNHYQALHQYDLAINAYKQQINEINKIESFLATDEFITKLNTTQTGKESTTPFGSIFNTDISSNQYLLALITSNTFHQALKNYQELVHLRHTLDKWQYELPALDMILHEKMNAYTRKLKDTVKNPALNLSRNFKTKRDLLARKLDNISTNEDVLKLATADELEKLDILQKAKQIIDRNPENFEEEIDKQHRIYGLMYWNIATDYIPRLWQATKTLQDLDKALEKTGQSQHSLSKSWQQAPTVFSGFAAEIKEKYSRITQLKNKTTQLMHTQQTHLKNMAIVVMRQQRDRLKLYQDRAMYSRARIYDSLIEK